MRSKTRAGQERLRCPDLLHDMVVSVCGSIWPPDEFDMHMHENLMAALSNIRLPGFNVVGIVGQSMSRNPIWVVHPRHLRYEKAVRENFRPKTIAPGAGLLLQGIFNFEGQAFYCIIRPMEEPGSSRNPVTINNKTADNPHLPDYIALILCRALGANASSDGEWDEFSLRCYRAVLPLLFDVFRHRERAMMPFAPELSELYWRAEVTKNRGGGTLPRPPWARNATQDQRHGNRETVTVSVDLRKSTFCMEQANSKERFGRWLADLVTLITRICHEHCGVFDKFTGDGGLLHFLDEECEHILGKCAVVAATECARELRAAISAILPQMRDNLRNDSDLLGAGIAIAVSEAFWSVDDRWNPIVVGLGVVDACRICDKTPPDHIRMSNAAYHVLKKRNASIAHSFHRILLGETKEHSDKQQLIGWELRAARESMSERGK